TRATLEKWTGIPASIGIAPTKTLAKLAAHLAKNSRKAGGVVNLVETRYLDAALARTDVADIWGIGPNYARMLREAGIKNALELRAADERWIRVRMGVAGLRILYELRGTSCMPLEVCPPPKKSLTVSRSFGSPVESLAEIREAVATYVSRAAEKLRRQQLTARVLVVFLATNRFEPSQHYSSSVVVNLPAPTDLTPELIRHALRGVEQGFRSGYQYKKAGVTLVELAPARPSQAGLCSEGDYERARRLMHVLDFVNTRMGPGTLRYATSGFKQRWRTLFAKRSARYTTEWKELLRLTEQPAHKPAL
ncbi:MAG TPA: DUF4113 domain-containing protein, partial [Pyrinomonadaceae bacterium]|nr:DUF4113 domain-containing protein [Pyrinomonadaceae bacterium]